MPAKARTGSGPRDGLPMISWCSPFSCNSYSFPAGRTKAPPVGFPTRPGKGLLGAVAELHLERNPELGGCLALLPQQPPRPDDAAAQLEKQPVGCELSA